MIHTIWGQGIEMPFKFYLLYPELTLIEKLAQSFSDIIAAQDFKLKIVSAVKYGRCFKNERGKLDKNHKGIFFI